MGDTGVLFMYIDGTWQTKRFSIFAEDMHVCGRPTGMKQNGFGVAFGMGYIICPHPPGVLHTDHTLL